MWSNSKGSGGTGVWPEGTTRVRTYKARREVVFFHKDKREVNLKGAGGTGIWPEGTPCERTYKAKREVRLFKKQNVK